MIIFKLGKYKFASDKTAEEVSDEILKLFAMLIDTRINHIVIGTNVIKFSKNLDVIRELVSIMREVTKK